MTLSESFSLKNFKFKLIVCTMKFKLHLPVAKHDLMTEKNLLFCTLCCVIDLLFDAIFIFTPVASSLQWNICNAIFNLSLLHASGPLKDKAVYRHKRHKQTKTKLRALIIPSISLCLQAPRLSCL